MTVLGGIVTFNPGIARLEECLDALTPQVDAVLVVDNGSENINDVERLLASFEHASCLSLGENKGIASALNAMLGEGRKGRFSYVLTMDQDSILGKCAVERMLQLAREGAALVCPWAAYEGNESYQQPRPNTAFDEVDWAITSGSLTSVAAWKAIGGFDEAMFIDGVDKDFCLRLRKAGYKVLRCNSAVLQHELGNLKCRKVLGRTIYVTNHSPMRRYYMVRNRIYLARKGVVSRSSAASGVAKEFTKVAFFESGRTEKLAAMWHGLCDGASMEVASAC